MTAALKPRVDLDDRAPLAPEIPLPTPWVVFVDPASACNFKCRFCPTGHRDLVADRFNGVMKLDLFEKIVDDLAEFDDKVKVLRLYKDGEPFLNKRLADMVAYAKASGHVERVDTTTNGALMTPDRLGPVLDAGIDRINVSVEGTTDAAYRAVAGVSASPREVLENVKWLWANRGGCEVAVKAIRETMTADEVQDFYDVFGEHCDRIWVENFSPCWPDFDGEARTGWKVTRGLYGQPINLGALVCSYVFYSYSVNPEGLVSACFVDWARRLVVGDARDQSMKSIWDGSKMNELRLTHLRGERMSHPVCGKCGQLSNCMPTDVDADRVELLSRFEASLEIVA